MCPTECDPLDLFCFAECDPLDLFRLAECDPLDLFRLAECDPLDLFRLAECDPLDLFRLAECDPLETRLHFLCFAKKIKVSPGPYPANKAPPEPCILFSSLQGYKKRQTADSCLSFFW